MPALLALFLVLLRLGNGPVAKSGKVFEPIDIDDKILFSQLGRFMLFDSSVKFELLYSPKNEYFEIIVKDATDALHLDGYKAIENSKSLEDELKSYDYFAGIQFDDDLANIKSYPNKLSFSLRFPSELRIKDPKQEAVDTWNTKNLFPPTLLQGIRESDSNEGGQPNYIAEGFIPLQHAISMSYLKRFGKSTTLPEIQMQRYPYPDHIEDKKLNDILSVVPVFLILSLMYSAICCTRYITTEKEKQLKEVMKIIGVQNWIHWTAWFIQALIIWFISIFLAVCLYKLPLADGAILQYSNFAVLLLFLSAYIITSICFCFMVAVFFTRAGVAAVAIGMFWIFLYVPYAKIERKTNMSPWTKLAWCLDFNTAMPFGFETIRDFEGVQEGVHFSNLFETVRLNGLPVGFVILMLLLDSIIYMTVCLYIEQVFPGKFGIPQKWNFPFTRNFWCRRTKETDNGQNDSYNKGHPRRDANFFEEEPEGKNVGVAVKNLKKKFSDRWVVKGLTMNMYEDEITVLLGHNGAGKTTTISMLVGMFPPTSGTAIVNGSDIRTNIDGARTSMGICPQHNVLFDDISVKNHMKIFSRLKGLKGKEIKDEVKKYLKMIDLEKKADTPAKKLSGGMKRKLSVCCALCGGTKVVLCDEPSSGMDPAARRQLWDILYAEKVGRTLVITTHYMDEADVLGDRIAIMYDGELKTYGTPFFLKKKFGSGYKLICVKREDCNVFNVTDLLQNYIPDIVPESDIGAELTYELPGDMSPVFEKMLQDLEKNSNILGLNGYGIGITSMEEVFLKVGVENTKAPESFDKKSAHLKGSFIDLRSRRPWKAMFLKNFLFTWRNKIGFILRHVFIIIYLITSFLSEKEKFTELPSMKMSLKQYPNAKAILEVTSDVVPDSLESRISEGYKSVIDSYGGDYELVSTDSDSFTTFLLDLERKSQWRVDRYYMAAATIQPNKITAWINSQTMHTAPMTLNLVHNAIAKAVIGPNAEISVTNDPLPLTATTKINRLNAFNIGSLISGDIGMIMIVVTALYIFMPIKERASNSKLVQFIGGVRISTFWITQFLWDLFTFTITSLVVITTIACFEQTGYVNPEDLMRVLLILIIFGFAVLFGTYLFGFLYLDAVKGFASIFWLNFFAGSLGFVITLVLRLLSGKKAYEASLWLFRLIPHFSMQESLNFMYQNCMTRKLCDDTRIIRLTPEERCTKVPDCCETVGYFDWKEPGVLREIIILLFDGFFSFLAIMFIDYNICGRLTFLNQKYKKKLENKTLDDDVAAEKERIASMSKPEIANHSLVVDRLTKYYGNFRAVNEISFYLKPEECFGLLGVNGAGKTSTFKMLTGGTTITFGHAYVRGISLKKLQRVYREIGYCPQFDALMDDLTGREVLEIYCLLRGVHRDRINAFSEELAQLFGFLRHIDKRTKNYSGGNKRKLSTAIAVLGNPSVIYLDEPTAGMDPGARRQLWNMVSSIRESGKSFVLTSHSMEECEALCTRLAIMVNGDIKCIGSIQHLKNKFSKGLILKIKVRHPNDETDMKINKEEASSMSYAAESSDDDGAERAKRLSLSLVSSTAGEGEPDPPATGQKSKREGGGKSSNKKNRPSNEPVNVDTEDENVMKLKTDVKNVKEALHKQYPLIELKEEYQRTLTFYIPLVNIKWSEIFGFMERNRYQLRIEDYSLSQTTLEEIFLGFANAQKAQNIGSKRKGCCKCKC